MCACVHVCDRKTQREDGRLSLLSMRVPFPLLVACFWSCDHVEPPTFVLSLWPFGVWSQSFKIFSSLLSFPHFQLPLYISVANMGLKMSQVTGFCFCACRGTVFAACS